MMTTNDEHSTTPTMNTAVLVKPPRCTSATIYGASIVEPAECQTIQCQWRKEESTFGAKEEENGDEKKVHELEERPISIVAAPPTADAPGGYDVCREYGYKYEYTQDHHEEEDDDDDDDSSSANPLLGESQSSNTERGHPLHQTTAVITKSQERIPYIFLLGRTYHPVHEYHARKEFEASLYWFTYRCDFPEITPYRITSDAGWGCMLRSAQMLLGHTLRIHFKSKHWKPPTSLAKCQEDTFVQGLMTWFADFPSKTESVYSLHNMVAAGFAKYETLPGEWYGPKTACYVLRDLVTLHHQTQPSLFRVHVSSEGTVYRDTVHALMTKDSKQRAEERQKLQSAKLTATPLHPLDPSIPPPSKQEPDSLEWDTSLLLLVPLRLGLDKFNEDYVESLAKSFWLPQSVGILGGRPRGARWFYGAYADGTKILGLDPHTVQAAPQRKQLNNKTVVDLSDEYIRSVHTSYPEVFPLIRMDPSLAIGFYCRDKKEFADLEASLKELKAAHPSSPDLFTFAKHSPDYLSSAVNDIMLGGLDDDDLGRAEEESDCEEYVLL